MPGQRQQADDVSADAVQRARRQGASPGRTVTQDAAGAYAAAAVAAEHGTGRLNAAQESALQSAVGNSSLMRLNGGQRGPSSDAATVQRASGSRSDRQQSSSHRHSSSTSGGHRSNRGAASGTAPAADATTTYELHIQVRVAERHPHRASLIGGFGHAWVALYETTSGVTSRRTYGFYPSTAPRRRELLSARPGEVRRGFDQADESATGYSVALTAEQVERAREYIHAHERTPYHLTNYNCSTFARGVYEAATGMAAPGTGLTMLENPVLLRDRLQSRNRRSGIDARGRNVEADEGRYTSSSSESPTGRGGLGGMYDIATGQPVGEEYEMADYAAPREPTPGRFEIE